MGGLIYWGRNEKSEEKQLVAEMANACAEIKIVV